MILSRNVHIVFAIIFVVFLSGCSSVQNTTENTPAESIDVASEVDTNPEQNWSMKEWYQNIPNEYNVDAVIQSNYLDPKLFEYSEIVDEKNYYYRVTGNYNRETGDGPYLSNASVTLTIFIANDGMRTVAISREACVFGCVTSEDDLVFLQFENGVWKNITNELPDYQAMISQFFEDTGVGCDPGGSTGVVLPRYGTTIDFDWGCEFGKSERQIIGQLKWNPKTGTFIMSKTY